MFSKTLMTGQKCCKKEEKNVEFYEYADKMIIAS